MTLYDLINKIIHNQFSKADLDAYLETANRSVNDQDKLQQTLLFYAIRDVNFTRLLLDEYDANPNIEDRFGYTPLMIAAVEGYLEVVQLLLAKEATVKSVVRGKTALHSCLKSDQCTIEIVELLLQNTDKTTLDIEFLGESALEIAIQKGNRPIVELLIEYGANVKKVLKKANNPENEYLISLADLYTILEDKGRLVEDESEDKDMVAHNEKILDCSKQIGIGLAPTPLCHNLANIVHEYYSLEPQTCSAFTTLFTENSPKTTPAYMLSKTASRKAVDTENLPSKKIRMADFFDPKHFNEPKDPKYFKKPKKSPV